MAGTRDGNFKELVSPFLKGKLEKIRNQFGEHSEQFNAIARQYLYDKSEEIIVDEERGRHYQSELNVIFKNRFLKGVERLYKKTVLLEPSTVCAAHCRWCLRGQYPIKTMKYEDIDLATEYLGSENIRDDVNEVLITGGDPLMTIPLLKYTINSIIKNSSNIRIIRIGTRVPFQDPFRINDKMIDLFSSYKQLKFEIGINVCHPIEFWEESIESIKKLQDVGVRMYNQNPLLKGVNDNIETLTELYSILRDLDIESHYLFHAIPMRGMSHHRTSLKKGLQLVNTISSSGEFSGRSKPKFSVLSDIGKIVIYQDSIVQRDKNYLLLKSGFNYKNRIKWNPTWKKPSSVQVNENGEMLTWYLDGND